MLDMREILYCIKIVDVREIPSHCMARRLYHIALQVARGGDTVTLQYMMSERYHIASGCGEIFSNCIIKCMWGDIITLNYKLSMGRYVIMHNKMSVGVILSHCITS